MFLSTLLKVCAIFFLLQVLPSNCQATNTKLSDVWVSVNKKDAWILTGNCSCIAGLSSTCSQVAALLFNSVSALHFNSRESTACYVRAQQSSYVDANQIKGLLTWHP